MEIGLPFIESLLTIGLFFANLFVAQLEAWTEGVLGRTFFAKDHAQTRKFGVGTATTRFLFKRQRHF
jgi:hypothetical protein